MSGAETLFSHEVTAVLLSLWDAHGRDVPMQELLRLTGVSSSKARTSLDALAARGCRIERTPAGVSLLHAGLATWRELIIAQARRHDWRLGRQAVVYPATESTNDAAWQMAGADDADGLVVLADYQTAGRGRLGRRWQAKPAQSILMSVLLHPMPAKDLDRLTLLAGLATAVGLERAVEAAHGTLAGGRLEIKWPNDVLAGGRKLAGILVETRRLSAQGRALEAVVVGIGVNVTQGAADFAPELGGRAISLFEASGLMPDRLRVILALLESLDAHLRLSAESQWLGHWKERCGMLGRRLSVRAGEREITGQVLDVAPLQGLLLRDDRGATHLLSARTCSIS